MPVQNTPCLLAQLCTSRVAEGILWNKQRTTIIGLILTLIKSAKADANDHNLAPRFLEPPAQEHGKGFNFDHVAVPDSEYERHGHLQTSSPTNSLASQHQPHRHHMTPGLRTAAGRMAMYSQPCVPMAWITWVQVLSYMAGKGLKFKWLFCIWINICSVEPKYLPLIFPPISGAVRYTK